MECKSGGIREAYMSKSDRQKASDIFANSTYALSNKGTFEETFPTIESCSVHVTEFTHPGARTAFWSGREHVDCSNKLCYGGGVSVGECLRSMVRDNQTERTFEEPCHRYEGSPKGEQRYRSCVHTFEVVVRVTYKDADTAEGEPPEDSPPVVDGES